MESMDNYCWVQTRECAPSSDCNSPINAFWVSRIGKADWSCVIYNDQKVIVKKLYIEFDMNW